MKLVLKSKKIGFVFGVICFSFLFNENVVAIDCNPPTGADYECYCYGICDGQWVTTPSEDEAYELYVVAVETPDKGNGKIAGVEYTIYNSTACTGQIIAESTSSSLQQNKHLIVKNSEYCIKTNSVPEGYQIPDPITGTLTASSVKKIQLYDKETEPTTGTLTLSFKDSSSNKYISGIKYSIYSSKTSNGCSGNVLKTGTSINGTQQITLNLSDSKYCLKVTEISDLYTIPDDTEINMSSSVAKSIKVNKKVIVDDTMSNISIALIVVGIIGLTSGAYLIYKNMKEKNTSKIEEE